MKMEYIHLDENGKEIGRFFRDVPDKNPVTPIPIAAEDATELSKARFEICKACDQSSEQGFKCALHKTCCFGRWRTKHESKCYQGKW